MTIDSEKFNGNSSREDAFATLKKQLETTLAAGGDNLEAAILVTVHKCPDGVAPNGRAIPEGEMAVDQIVFGSPATLADTICTMAYELSTRDDIIGKAVDHGLKQLMIRKALDSLRARLEARRNASTTAEIAELDALESKLNLVKNDTEQLLASIFKNKDL